MKSNLSKKVLGTSLLALVLILTHIACSNTAFKNAYMEPGVSQEQAVIRGPASIPAGTSFEQIANNGGSAGAAAASNLTKPVVEGYATGVQSQTNAYQYEKWAFRGSHIQIHYSISAADAYQTAFQVFPKDGAEEIGNFSVDQVLLAQAEDGRPYVYAQFTNLEKSRGFHTYNLPLKFRYNNGREQYLKTGAYKLFITSCKTADKSTCHKSAAIHFEVK